MKSKITKILMIICLLGSLSLFASCNLFKNSYKTLESGAIITVPDELKQYFKYPNDVPSMHFGYENINVTKASTSAYCIFVQNDFYKISDAWGEHLNTYTEDQIVILSENPQNNETTQARLGGEYLPLDEYVDGVRQETSLEYHTVATTSDGTRYSYVYRTFVSGGKRYYGYAYTDNLTITMELSLMVIRGEKNNQLLLLPLPFDTKYEVSGQTLTIQALTNRDTYLDDKYYTFLYPEYLSSYNDTEKVTKMSEWYEKHCEGEYIEDELYINYAGARFKVDFNRSKEDSQTKETVRAFGLIYLGDATK